MTTEASLSRPEVSTGMRQLDSSMHPDILLPAQYFYERRKRSPEHRLMMAVLYEALHCLEKYRFASDLKGRRLFFEAEQWFVSEQTEWSYSFERICEALDLDAAAVRHRLRRAVARGAVDRPEPRKRGRKGLPTPAASADCSA